MSESQRPALLTLRRKRVLARLSREGLDYRGGPLEGYVLAVGTDLVLIHRVDHMMVLDGYAVWRLSDITSIDTSFPSRRFIEGALRLRGFRARPPDRAFPLSSVSAVLVKAQSLFPLVTIHLERRFRHSCWIGQVSRITASSLLLREISPSATWDPQRWYRFSTITAIEFGGSYEDALARVARVQPNPSLQRTRFARR